MNEANAAPPAEAARFAIKWNIIPQNPSISPERIFAISAKLWYNSPVFEKAAAGGRKTESKDWRDRNAQESP